MCGVVNIMTQITNKSNGRTWSTSTEKEKVLWLWVGSIENVTGRGRLLWWVVNEECNLNRQKKVRE